MLIFVLLSLLSLGSVPDQKDDAKILSKLNERSKRYKEGLAHLVQAYRILNALYSDLHDVSFEEALEKFHCKQYEESVELLKKLIVQNGEKIQYLYFLAESFWKLNKFNQATTLYNKIINIVGEKKFSWHEEILDMIEMSYLKLAQYLEKKNKIPSVIALLEKYVRLFSKQEAYDFRLVKMCQKYKVFFVDDATVVNVKEEETTSAE